MKKILYCPKKTETNCYTPLTVRKEDCLGLCYIISKLCFCKGYLIHKNSATDSKNIVNRTVSLQSCLLVSTGREHVRSMIVRQRTCQIHDSQAENMSDP